MDITFSGRHCTIPDETKEAIKGRLEHFFANIPIKLISSKVVIDLEDQTRIKTEIIVHAKDHTFEAHNESFHSTTAINEAIDKIEVQVRRFIDRKQDHRA